MNIQKIYIGGWFQRTTLHLSEIYDFLKKAESPPGFNKKKLKDLRDALVLDTITFNVEDLEYIKVTTTSNIDISIYEDGLIVLSKKHDDDIPQDIEALTTYYETLLSPALSYIFSLGAPIPKELASIKTIYPYFIVLDRAEKHEIENLLQSFKQDKYFEIKKETFEIYRGNKLYVINNISEQLSDIEFFINEQIFFREFKGQLHRYLNLHRIIWEKIAAVKERGEIKGKNIGAFKNKIESYNKTINLIEARINQMGIYIGTRERVVKKNESLARFADVVQFKYQTLGNTLSYVKDIWNMTKNYVNSALTLFSAIQAKSTESSVKNLTVITSMGVGATLLGLFSKKPPEFTMFGAIYFFVLALIGFTTNKIMKTIYKNKMYKISDIKAAKDIK